MSGRKHLVYAAIDFGTTYSGYAYAFKHDLEETRESKQSSVFVPQWKNLLSTGTTDKTPTSILFRPDSTFHSFGYKAEYHYVELADNGTHTGWRFFKQFKMKLHNVKLRRNMKIKDEQGQKMDAMDLFSESIRFLADHLYQSVKKSRPDFEREDIFWVITVPGVWKYNAKVFMKEAASKAELSEDRLAFVHEPEAASILVKDLKFKRELGDDGTADFKQFKAGKRFMLLDLGGGTIDIFAGEIQEDGSLKELCPKNGGHWGGTLVDEAIYRSIADFIGNDKLKEFKETDYEAYYRLLDAIQTTKCTIDRTDGYVRLVLPYGLRDVQSNLTSNEGTADECAPENMYIKKDKLNIHVKCWLKAFEDPSSVLKGAVGDLLQMRDLEDIDTIIMVGGFSESMIMQQTIIESFPGMSVIVPEHAKTAVLRGAVLYGFSQDLLQTQKLPYSYGTCTTELYDRSRHKLDCVVRNGKVEDVFKMFLRKGTDIQHGNIIVEHSVMSGLTEANIEIYQTSADNLPEPSLTTNPGFERIGTISIPVDSKRMIDIRMTLENFDIKVEAKDHDSSEWKDFTFNHLL